MLNSVEPEILISHKYKNIKTFSMLFFVFINVKLPTIVGVLTFMSRKNPCSAALSMKFFYNLEA